MKCASSACETLLIFVLIFSSELLVSAFRLQSPLLADLLVLLESFHIARITESVLTKELHTIVIKANLIFHFTSNTVFENLNR